MIEQIWWEFKTTLLPWVMAGLVVWGLTLENRRVSAELRTILEQNVQLTIEATEALKSAVDVIKTQGIIPLIAPSK